VRRGAQLGPHSGVCPSPEWRPKRTGFGRGGVSLVRCLSVLMRWWALRRTGVGGLEVAAADVCPFWRVVGVCRRQRCPVDGSAGCSASWLVRGPETDRIWPRGRFAGPMSVRLDAVVGAEADRGRWVGGGGGGRLSVLARGEGVPALRCRRPPRSPRRPRCAPLLPAPLAGPRWPDPVGPTPLARPR
jgi:hypothetical protein